MDAAALPEDEERQRVFYGHVRESIISLLLGVGLYLLAYYLVAHFLRHRSRDECYSGEEDSTVYRIATWLSSFAVCVSLGSVLLLPLSIASNEVLVHYPNSYYVKWLNTSLIRGLWNQVFVGSNLCLFLLLPFAYFFTESEGLAGSRKGLMARVQETALLLGLLAVLAMGLAGLAAALVTEHRQAPHWWFLSLPLLYSMVAMLGVLLTSVCTPLGFSCLFTVLGNIITKPKLHSCGEVDIERLRLEEAALQRRHKLGGGDRGRLGRGGEQCGVQEALADIQRRRKELERHLRSPRWERQVLYPLCFLLLLAMTVLSLALVAVNCLTLTLHPTSMPLAVQEYLLGTASTSNLGALGAAFEVIVILYFICASVVGFYNSPVLSRLRPHPHDTPMTKVIANCIILLVLSSALPLLARTLGITQFNLLGRFGSLEWLGNWWLVLGYNLLFFALTVTILCLRVSRAVLREASLLLGARLGGGLWWRREGHKSPSKTLHSD